MIQVEKHGNQYGWYRAICPECGSAGKMHEKALNTWVVECLNNQCMASYMTGWDYDTEEEAAEAWNRRADDGKE